jgi:hypothetical protein
MSALGQKLTLDQPARMSALCQKRTSRLLPCSASSIEIIRELQKAYGTTLSTLPTTLIEALHDALTLKPADDSQRTAQSEMVKAIDTAMDARRQRIVVSQSAVGTVKWAGILLQGLCTLVAIAMVHSDNRLACAIAMTLFATGIALSLLLIAAYSRPFTGQISVRTS